MRVAVLTERDGCLLRISRQHFVRDISMFAYGETDAIGPRRFDRIVSIDKSGPDTAVIKLHLGGSAIDREDRLLTDYLMLIRVGGGWRIVTRVYTPRHLPS